MVPSLPAQQTQSPSPAYQSKMHGPLTSQALVESYEREILDAINYERRYEKLPELRLNAALTAAARKHSALMAERNALNHQLPGEPRLQLRVADAGVHFSRVAENLGVGEDVQSIHAGLMLSAGHRANILEPENNEVGIGVVINKHGLWVTQDFAHIVPDLSSEQQVEVLTAKLRSLGVTVNNLEHNANFSCGSSLPSSTHTAMTVVHIETSDLDAMPQEFLRMADEYHYASIAACPVQNKHESAKGFVRYRFAIIFY